jgi:hypothetical protein
MNVFTIRIIYKSGATQDFECTEFSIKDGLYSWTALGDVKPLMIGLVSDQIAAVWQVAEREVL